MKNNKLKKKLVLGLSLLLVLGSAASCSGNDDFDGLRVKFYNETNFNIVNLEIGGVEIGKLDKNKSTEYIIYDLFGFDTGMPDEGCIGDINGELAKSYTEFYWCGTEKSHVTEGVYEMAIHLIEVDSVKYFRLSLK